jgi:hypothetical protein
MPVLRMVEWAHRRYAVEQFHQESKTLLGWDQYQGRLWQGFHRNAVLVMLAHSFLVWFEWQNRQLIKLRGRPRGALSPSPGSQTPVSALDSPLHR